MVVQHAERLKASPRVPQQVAQRGRETRAKEGSWLGLLGSIGLCEAAGIVGALATDTGRSVWYRALRKPSFTPPSQVFAPVWTVLYALMGICLHELWQRRERPEARPALRAFAMQYLLNAGWTPVFFGMHSASGGLIVIVALWVELMETVLRSRRVSTKAAVVLLPYLLWVSFALVLNAAIVWKNPSTCAPCGSAAAQRR